MRQLFTRAARRGLRATVIAVVGAAMLATPAWGSHGGDANSGDPDDAMHYVDRNNLTSLGNTAALRGVAQLDRSHMNATFSGTGDVEVYDGGYGDTSWAGLTDCIDSGWWGECDVFRIRFNTTVMAGSSAGLWRSLGCHEFGHTGGLGHRTSATDTDNNSCMRSTLSSGRQSFDTHDLNAINGVL